MNLKPNPMTNQESLQKIVGHLPHKLKVKIKDVKTPIGILKGDILKVTGFRTFSEVVLLEFKKQGECASIKDCIPILRPLSDLTKPIKHNSEEFVPIVELAKIEAGNIDDGEFIKGDIGIPIKIHTRSQEYHPDAYIFEHQDKYSLKEYFSYKGGDFNKMYSNGNGFTGCVVNNQQLLFQKIYEWHFDIHGLIEKGLAININTLEI